MSGANPPTPFALEPQVHRQLVDEPMAQIARELQLAGVTFLVTRACPKSRKPNENAGDIAVRDDLNCVNLTVSAEEPGPWPFMIRASTLICLNILEKNSSINGEGELCTRRKIHFEIRGFGTGSIYNHLAACLAPDEWL